MVRKALRGILPKQADVKEWSPEKRLSFLRFALFFMEFRESKGKMQHVFSVVPVKIEAARAENDEFWPEFLMRIEDKKEMDPKQFQVRLITATRNVLAWLKQNPFAVSPQMEAVMEGNERFRWALATFKEREDGIVVMDQRETTDPNHANAATSQTNVVSPVVQYHQSIMKLTSVVQNILESITPEDLKKLDAAKKINLALNGLNTLAKALGKGQMPSKVFNTLIIKDAGKDDLERSLLEHMDAASADEEET